MSLKLNCSVNKLNITSPHLTVLVSGKHSLLSPSLGCDIDILLPGWRFSHGRVCWWGCGPRCRPGTARWRWTGYGSAPVHRAAEHAGVKQYTHWYSSSYTNILYFCFTYTPTCTVAKCDCVMSTALNLISELNDLIVYSINCI